MNCANCNVVIPQCVIDNQDDYKKTLFYTVCYRCMNTCGECGQDIGFSKSSIVSDYECSFCCHQSCRSCLINLMCEECGITACESCIDNDNIGGCTHLEVKLNSLRRLLSKVNLNDDAERK